MIQVTIFSGHAGQLRYDKLFYLTLFGGCELIRPTVARQMLSQRQAERGQWAPGRKPFFLTIFGGVTIKLPTLAEEFIDLRDTMVSGMLTMEDWERAMGDPVRIESCIASFTVFGGFDECKLPSENQEIESLAVQRHLGNISDQAGQLLQYGIGLQESERRATLRRAVLADA